MSASAPGASLAERYSRALRRTAPKLATESPGVAVEGYWIDTCLFYFLAEDQELCRGRSIPVPSIADCNTGSVAELIPPRTLIRLLSEHSNQSLQLEHLCVAEFDMPDRDTLAVSVAGVDYLLDTRKCRVISSRASLSAPGLFSPDRHYVCLSRQNNLWLRELSSGAERALTTDGEPHCAYGQESETNLAALTYRNHLRPVGLWSPDSQWFLTHRIDEREVPELPLIQHVTPEGGRPVLHSYKYAVPGDPLPAATLVAIHIATGRTISFDDFPVAITSFSPFFMRRAWFETADTVWLVRLDRYCKHAELIRLDLRTGTGRIVLSEAASAGYLELHPLILGTPNIRTLAHTPEVIWYSERDGWGHLYLYDTSTGALKNRITRGKWLVRDIVHVDEEHRQLLILAGGVDAEADRAYRCLCRVDFDGNHCEILLRHDGDLFVPMTEPGGPEQDRPFRPAHATSGLSPDRRFGVVRYASIERGNRTELVDLRTRRGLAIVTTRPHPGEIAARRFVATAADGLTRLHGVLFFPSDFDDSRQYPLVDWIYPGPQVACQAQAFGSVICAQPKALAELGFVTMMLDTRGMPHGSRAFHQIGYGGLLEPQLSDHAAVVRQLCERHRYIDAQRIGIIGHSGGGAATARALFDYGDIYKVGVATCGNHDSNLYAAIWSDKYRGPGEAAAWLDQANTTAAHKLRGKLLLISGDMDENVHISQTFSLADALIRANRDFDLLVVPNAGHLVLVTHGYAQRRAWDYFVRYLLGQAPPTDFEIRFEPHELEIYARRYAKEVRQL